MQISLRGYAKVLLLWQQQMLWHIYLAANFTGYRTNEKQLIILDGGKILKKVFTDPWIMLSSVAILDEIKLVWYTYIAFHFKKE